MQTRSFLADLRPLWVATCACALVSPLGHAGAASTSPSDVWIQWFGPDGWGNRQGCYVPENNQLTSHGLVQSVTNQPTICGHHQLLPYATAQMSWKSYSFTYGVIQYRAKLAGGKGTWPSIWLLGKQCQPYGSGPDCHWPKSGSNEIDLTEVKVNLSSRHAQPYRLAWQNAFNQRTGGVLTCIPQISDVTKNYHDYKFVWSPSSLTWFVDGVQTCATSSPDFIPTTPMFVLIDVYLGKKNGGGPIVPATFPTSTNVQYLRICPVGTPVCDTAHASIFDDEFRPGFAARYRHD